MLLTGSWGISAEELGAVRSSFARHVASSEDAGDSTAQEEGRGQFLLQLCTEASYLVTPGLRSSLSNKVVTRAAVWINIAVDKVPSEVSC